jgi:hypothetical protein
MKLIRPKARPIFEFEVWPYKDGRVVAHATCNRCGEKFSMTLRVNSHALPALLANEAFIKARLIKVASEKHFCDEESLVQDKAETNRIVNKWHEYKIKAKRAFGEKHEKPARNA